MSLSIKTIKQIEALFIKTKPIYPPTSADPQYYADQLDRYEIEKNLHNTIFSKLYDIILMIDVLTKE